jgi:carbonic anhydrase/acetyltransferase-like protein (isoleucine patch superfamily)
MGTPARVVRSVSAADLSMIVQGAAHYRARMLRYRRELQQLDP